MKLKEIISYIILILAIILLRTFIITQIRVDGDSMNDTLQDGNLMFLKRYEKNSVDRFDIVIFKIKDEKLIKRVIALPEEDIEYKDNKLYINGVELTNEYGFGTTEDFVDYCGKDEYFVLGDNRTNSIDSRIFGCVNKENFLGTADFRFFPLNKIGKVK